MKLLSESTIQRLAALHLDISMIILTQRQYEAQGTIPCLQTVYKTIDQFVDDFDSINLDFLTLALDQINAELVKNGLPNQIEG